MGTVQPGELNLEINRVLPAAPEVVFRAFSVQDELAGWWGPVGFSVASIEFRPRVGDRYRIEMKPPEARCLLSDGRVSRGRSATSALIHVRIRESGSRRRRECGRAVVPGSGDSTEVSFTQHPFKTEARRDLHRNGWTDSFDRLEQAILRRSLKKHVLILGAGFAGLELAARLSASLADAVQVTLLDKNDSFHFGFSKLDVLLGRQAAPMCACTIATSRRRGSSFVRRA